MLGPVDLADWDYDETDVAKAELRLDPLAHEIARRYSRASTAMTRRLRELVGKLFSGAAMERAEIDELRDALANADRSGATGCERTLARNDSGAR